MQIEGSDDLRSDERIVQDSSPSILGDVHPHDVATVLDAKGLLFVQAIIAASR